MNISSSDETNEIDEIIIEKLKETQTVAGRCQGNDAR